MRHRTCPDCNAEILSKGTKLRLSCIGGRVQCPNCQATLVAGGRLLATILGAFGGSVLFYVAIYSLGIGSPFPVAALVFSLLSMVIAGVYFLKPKRVGVRHFNI